MRMQAAVALSLLLAPLALSSCRSGTEPGILVKPGRYVLQSIDGRALPTAQPCGVFDALSGTIRLEADGGASYTLRLASWSGGGEVTYTGTGRYRREGSGIVLHLRGRWSHQETEHDHSIPLQVGPLQLLEGGVGMECDASSTREYRLRVP
jgi:hypothetical protein